MTFFESFPQPILLNSFFNFLPFFNKIWFFMQKILHKFKLKFGQKIYLPKSSIFDPSAHSILLSLAKIIYFMLILVPFMLISVLFMVIRNWANGKLGKTYGLHYTPYDKWLYSQNVPPYSTSVSSIFYNNQAYAFTLLASISPL